jgi:nucleoside-diphosphate-sugar epimerase
MKVIFSGGTDRVGTVLARALHERGDEVVVLSRSPSDAPWRVLHWDAETLGDWAVEFEGAEVVINLAGRRSTAATTPRIADYYRVSR